MTAGFEPAILTSPSGPTHGPAASVLALGAPGALTAQVFWNSPERPGAAPGVVDATVDERLAATRRWQITSAESWLHVTDRFIRGEHIRSRPAETALDVRDAVLEENGAAYLSVGDWIDAVDEQGRRAGWDEARTALVLRLAVKAFHAEQQLAEDGLLPAGRRVVTMFAYDLAHAAYLIHAGARLGYSDPQTVQQMHQALAHNASAVYTSWQDYAAAYVLGHSLLEGGYPSDEVYRSAAATAKLLLSSPLSPWTNIGFPGRN